MSGADVLVVPLERGWEVRRAGEKYPTSRHHTRWAAIRAARTMAAESRTEVIIHGLDGTITVDAMV